MPKMRKSAQSGNTAPCGPPALSFFSFFIFASLTMTLNGQLVCWHALLRCHQERDCDLAYNQYLLACEGILRGTRRQCPSHCIGALVRLNQTSSGPELETCNCGQDELCHRAKKAIEPCMPRTHSGGMGCTEARQHCDENPSCRSSLTGYLSSCGQLFNGRKCSARCKATIEELLFMPDGAMLDKCVCDGVERPFCEVVKENMAKLCFSGERGAHTDQDSLDDVYEDEDYEAKGEREVDVDAVVQYSGAEHFSSHIVLISGSVLLTFLKA
uniref:GDNF/GAS1 domain-containing protein n=1 Tax=Astyanax mexicanus TaxID=7994 RepID=A0A8B9JVQ1_ASTMX